MLTNEIEKIRNKISKRNFKSGEESKLHFRLDGLTKIKNGLSRDAPKRK